MGTTDILVWKVLGCLLNILNFAVSSFLMWLPGQTSITKIEKVGIWQLGSRALVHSINNLFFFFKYMKWFKQIQIITVLILLREVFIYFFNFLNWPGRNCQSAFFLSFLVLVLLLLFFNKKWEEEVTACSVRTWSLASRQVMDHLRQANPSVFSVLTFMSLWLYSPRNSISAQPTSFLCTDAVMH